MRAFLLVLAVLAAASWSVRARADDDAHQAEVLAAALKKFDEGRVAFEAHRYDEARAAFEASNRLQASPNSLLYIGRCWRETGKVASAYVTLERSARLAEERLATTHEKRYAATRDAAAAEAAALEPRVPRLTVAVPSAASLPPDFAVQVGGETLPRESWGVAVETDPGPVVVTATGSRMHPFREDVTLAPGEKRRVDVRADRVPTATLAVRLSSWPAGVVVEIDGVAIDPRDAGTPHELDAGRHVVSVRAPAYMPFRWERELADGERRSVTIDLAPAPVARRGPAPWLFWASLGAAVLATGAATVLAFDANARDNRELGKNPLLRDPGTRDGIRTEATIANALFVSGALLGVGAAVLFFTTDFRAARAPEAAAP